MNSGELARELLIVLYIRTDQHAALDQSICGPSSPGVVSVVEYNICETKKKLFDRK